VEANETARNVLPVFGTSYENIYRILIPSGVMLVYVFDGSTLEEEGWDYVKKQRLGSKKI